MTKAILDHVAIGTRATADAWELFGGVLGGVWAYGGDSAGFSWGQLRFASGPKVEILTPDTSPDSAFLERFLAARGSGPHHFNFIVPDITQTLSRVEAFGIEPVGVRLGNPNWKEAFLHPRDATGIVIQVAQQGSGQSQPEIRAPAPAGLPLPGPSCVFALIDHQVTDLVRAIRLFRDVLDGEVTISPAAGQPESAELTWGNGARVRLFAVPADAVQPNAGPREAGPREAGPREAGPREAGPREAGPREALRSLRFVRGGQPFSSDERSRAAELARRLGVPLDLSG